MTVKKQNRDGDRFDFYSGHYARFGSRLAAEIRREVYGEDLGQSGWRTLEEQGEIVALIREQLPSHFLDIACGSGALLWQSSPPPGVDSPAWTSSPRASGRQGVERPQWD